MPFLPFLFVVSSPSGTGKTLLTQTLCAQDPLLCFSISVTTRPPRPHEVNGKDYHFITSDIFDQYVQEDLLAEHAMVFGHGYGTLKTEIQPQEEVVDQKDRIFDIDWQGMHQLKKAYPGRVVSIFLLPPSRDVLEARLRHRDKDSEASILHRMEKSKNELEQWRDYDYLVVNEAFSKALEEVSSIIACHRLKKDRQYHKALVIEHTFQ